MEWTTTQKVYPRGYPHFPATVGEHIRKKRMDLKLYQEDAAKLLNTSAGTIKEWECGHSTPNILYTKRVIEFLGFNPWFKEPTHLGEALYQFRIRNSLTAKVMGKKLGVDPSTVLSWEKGKHRIPNPMKEVLRKLPNA